jgi:hypothetical protein
MRTLSIACVLGAPLLAFALQAGGQKPPQDEPSTATERVRVDRKKLRDDIQGAWRLIEFQTASLPSKSRKDVGYCLISGSCLSLELHMGWMPDPATIQGRGFQSGTHTFEIDDEGQLRTSTLIGAYINRASVLEFDRPGYARTYTVTVANNQLSMARADGQTLVFERMLDVMQERDFFGRPKREAPKSNVDEKPDSNDEPRK